MRRAFYLFSKLGSYIIGRNGDPYRRPGVRYMSLMKDPVDRKIEPLIPEITDPRVFPSIVRKSSAVWENLRGRIERLQQKIELYGDLFASPLWVLCCRFQWNVFYMSLEYGNWDVVYELDATYADVDHIVGLLWDPTAVEYFMALRKTLDDMNTGLDWLLFASHFEKLGDTNIAYEAKSMAYLVEGGKLEEFGNLVERSPVPQRSD
eukprot:jgi/Galph1/4543/GphlegSOOS_G3193.1